MPERLGVFATRRCINPRYFYLSFKTGRLRISKLQAAEWGSGTGRKRSMVTVDGWNWQAGISAQQSCQHGSVLLLQWRQCDRAQAKQNRQTPTASCITLYYRSRTFIIIAVCSLIC